MLRHVALVRTDVSEEYITSIIRVTRLGELGMIAVTSNRSMLWNIRLLVTANIPSSPILVTLMMEAIHSSETSVLIGATHRNIPEDSILQNIICFSICINKTPWPLVRKRTIPTEQLPLIGKYIYIYIWMTKNYDWNYINIPIGIYVARQSYT
jgi:hypothetical protein